MHKAMENQKTSFKIEQEIFEKKQLEFEEMKENLMSRSNSSGGAYGEESKGGAGLSIAGMRQRLADGGSGADTFVPVVIENNTPPSYVAARAKAHETGGQCVVFRPQGNKVASAGNDGFVKLWQLSLKAE